MIRVESAQFAVAVSNALAFIPAASKIKHARMIVDSDYIEFVGTDGYAAGRDYCEVHSFTDDPEEFVGLIPRDALTAWDSAARRDKKGIGVITVFDDGRGIQFSAQDEEIPAEPCHVGTFDHPELFEVYETIDTALETPQPFRVAFQPQLLQRFSKVKADKTERVADLAINDPDAPVLVKIGPTFRGLIMPVYREQHAIKQGEEGLWEPISA